jgi:hypothetical protein
MCGEWPDNVDVKEALDFHDPRLRDYTRTYDERRSSMEDIVEGALRLAAGRIFGQKLQEDHGEKDLLAAIQRLEEYRAEQKVGRRGEGGTISAGRKNPRQVDPQA